MLTPTFSCKILFAKFRKDHDRRWEMLFQIALFGCTLKQLSRFRDQNPFQWWKTNHVRKCTYCHWFHDASRQGYNTICIYLIYVTTCIIFYLQIPGLCSGVLGESEFIPADIGGITKGVAKCEYVVGYRGVYAICFGMVCFFAFMCILMLCVSSSKDPRASFQNGWVETKKNDADCHSFTRYPGSSLP